MSKRKTKRDTYNYTLKQGRRIVGFGVTNSPDRRLKEQKRSRKRFTSMDVSPFPCSRATAHERERERIKHYQSSHGGKKPRYNK